MHVAVGLILNTRGRGKKTRDDMREKGFFRGSKVTWLFYGFSHNSDILKE
jgi:hypothetical protein